MSVKTKAQFLSEYPEYSWIWDKEKQHLVEVNEKDRKYRPAVWLKCADCGKDLEVFVTNASRDSNNDGKFRCLSCGDRLNPPDIGAYLKWCKENPDASRERMNKGANSPEVRHRVWEIMTDNGVHGQRSGWETEIDKYLGSCHVERGSLLHDGTIAVSEGDCVWEELRLLVEIDGPGHYECLNPGCYQCRQGKHRDKDKWWESKGFTVLHLTHRKLNLLGSLWRVPIIEFLNGTYTGPLIDLTDITYGDIVY